LAAGRNTCSWKSALNMKAVENRQSIGGSDGTRTRNLCRDRAAL
jgi:hypothetical protein